MRTCRTFAVTLFAVCLLAGGCPAAAQPTPQEVTRAVEALSLPHGAEIVSAFQTGFSQNRLSPDDAFSLVERLGASGGSKSDQDAILLTIGHALEEGLPVAILMSKAAEGLARGVPLSSIAQGLVLREHLLAAVRDLLYSKSIFRAKDGTPAVPPSLPGTRFDLLVTHIADSLADYVDGGGSPLDGYALLAEVTKRLTLLKGSVIPAEDVELVLGRIAAADLTATVLEALNESQS
jgi:hypothetical protein